ncbi:MAG: DUF368 domain-containing protein [Deltaproteobacteria bacterium]|nr:DUF368 domain-containing protein [Deltaproteobacteria bacterium]
MSEAEREESKEPMESYPGVEPPSSRSLLAARCAIGGVLMGLANLVPGISGGTMLLASGVYPRFIEAIAEVTTFKFKKRSMLVLGVVVACAVLSILLFAGTVKGLVVEHRWVMYSLFIGLTLGGLPVVWKEARPAHVSTWIAAVLAFAAMAALSLAQSHEAGGSVERDGALFLFIAGVAGASAMILPGVSGGYLLLLMGVYVPILGGVDALKQALKAGDVSAAMGPMTSIVIPVGLGVVVGVLVVSNLLGWLLRRFEKPTLGALLGLLLGAVIGLWPFQEGVAPVVGSVFKGRVMTAESLTSLSPDKYPTQFFDPSAAQIAAALGLVLLGYGITALVARFGSDEADASEAEAASGKAA